MLVPELCANLLSVSQLTAKGLRVEFTDQRCWIMTKGGEGVATASKVNGMYRIDLAKTEVACMAKNSITQLMWHRRLGHIGVDNLK